MDKKELKKIMTDLAAGHISQKEADILLEGVETPWIKPKKEIEGKSKGNARKRELNAKGGKIK